MEVVVSDGLISLVFKGVFGILILLYIIMEIGFLYWTRMTFIQMLLVNIGLKRRLKKIIPPWWYVHNKTQLFGINRPLLKYRVWVEFRLKSDSDTYWKKVNGWIHLDRLGRVENRFELENTFIDKDKEVPDSIKKKYHREKILNKLV
jgi:hypothetical protein